MSRTEDAPIVKGMLRTLGLDMSDQDSGMVSEKAAECWQRWGVHDFFLAIFHFPRETHIYAMPSLFHLSEESQQLRAFLTTLSGDLTGEDARDGVDGSAIRDVRPWIQNAMALAAMLQVSSILRHVIPKTPLPNPNGSIVWLQLAPKPMTR